MQTELSRKIKQTLFTTTMSSGNITEDEAHANDQPTADLTTQQNVEGNPHVTNMATGANTGLTTQNQYQNPFPQGQSFGSTGQGFDNPGIAFGSISGSNQNTTNPGFHPAMAAMPQHQHLTMSGVQQGHYAPPPFYPQGFMPSMPMGMYPGHQMSHPAPQQGTGQPFYPGPTTSIHQGYQNPQSAIQQSADSAEDRWVFNPQTGAVTHVRRSCKICDEMTMHTLEAIAENVSSYANACAARTKHYHESGNTTNSNDGESRISLQTDLSKLRGQVSAEKREIERLRHEQDKDQKALDRLCSERDGLKTSRDQLLQELEKTRETMNYLQDRVWDLKRETTYNSPVREGKRKRRERSLPPSMDSPPPRGEEGPIDYDDIHSNDIVLINIETPVSDVFEPISSGKVP